MPSHKRGPKIWSNGANWNGIKIKIRMRCVPTPRPIAKARIIHSRCAGIIRFRAHQNDLKKQIIMAIPKNQTANIVLIPPKAGSQSPAKIPVTPATRPAVINTRPIQRWSVKFLARNLVEKLQRCEQEEQYPRTHMNKTDQRVSIISVSKFRRRAKVARIT